MATFWANEINSTEGDIMGPTEIMFPLKGKKYAGYLKTFFLVRR